MGAAQPSSAQPSPAQPSPASQPQILKPNIGPKVQNHPKSLQIQPSFRVKIGSSFVHLTKFHRRSESFFGARLFSFTIWTHIPMVSMKLAKMCPTHTQSWFPQNEIWAVLGRHGSVWAENRCIRTQIALRTSFSKSRSRFWPNFVRAWAPGPLVSVCSESCLIGHCPL